MENAILAITGFGLVVLLATVFFTATLTRFLESNTAIVVGGGLLVPALLAVWGFYDLAFNLEVDSPPPGMLLIGGAIMLAITVPFTLLASLLTVWYGRRCYKRRVR